RHISRRGAAGVWLAVREAGRITQKSLREDAKRHSSTAGGTRVAGRTHAAANSLGHSEQRGRKARELYEKEIGRAGWSSNDSGRARGKGQTGARRVSDRGATTGSKAGRLYRRGR